MNQWIDQHASASWMLIVANHRQLQRWNNAIAARHPGRERTGSGMWQSRPYQAIVAAKDAPVESAWISFQQVFVLEPRCLLTDSLRELHEDVRVPIALIRSRYEHYSAAEELLLERLAGPVVVPNFTDPASRTVVIRFSPSQHLTAESLTGLLQLFNSQELDEHYSLPRSLTIVVGTAAGAAEYRAENFGIQDAIMRGLNCAVMTLEEVVLEGLPTGIVVFTTDTESWLSTRGRFPLRGSKLRIVIDASGSTGARYNNNTLTISELQRSLADNRTRRKPEGVRRRTARHI